ncbi:MAG: NADH:ubiquinone reductase (Na(+)-transporting) subunit C [Chlamydiales bacterium]|nr:NADH:ubiquinone reductase (Na(+)-transporting) subunit C [Chlamydiales bacterium]
MAEPQHKNAPHTDFQILLFIVSLCLICGLLLSVVAFALAGPQKAAREFDRSRQMLIAAKILSGAGYFLIFDEETGKVVPAKFDPQNQILVKVEDDPPRATDEEIRLISELRIRPLLTTATGDVTTFEEQKLLLSEYLEERAKEGYADLPLKLFYAILPNEPNAGKITAEEIAQDLSQVYAIVIPVSGFGLWGPIYGYIALKSNAKVVIGTTWYEHAETPGLGANIAEASWQQQFFGKLIFQPAPDGTVDLQTADMGIIVVKGRVDDVFRGLPRAKSAVDGISGATLTGDGVTAAYKNSLTPYREFLIRVHEASKTNE